jgi:hypothetical protein
MSRLETLVRQHPITIETSILSRRAGERVLASTPFTLHLEANAFSDEMHAEHTITPTEAITTVFHLIDAGQRDPTFWK